MKRGLRSLATCCRRLADWLDARASSTAGSDLSEDEVVLFEADYQELSLEVARHAAAVQRQVSHYADVLAGDDTVLRERLRQFEGGGRS